MEACSQHCLSCSMCDYTTRRSYNLKRHIEMVHKYNVQKVPEEVGKVSKLVGKVPETVEKVPFYVGKVPQLSDTNSGVYKCDECYKTFSSETTLKRHASCCKGVSSALECHLCGDVMKNKTAKWRHMKICTGQKLIDEENRNVQTTNVNNSYNHTTNNINTLNNIGTQNNYTNENVKILVFPEEGEDFDFIISHIKDAVMKEIISSNRPLTGFKKFMSKVFKNKQNRMIKKSNIKDAYSHVHAGENKWVPSRDQRTMPIVAHHMTTAALEKMSDMKKRKVLDNMRHKVEQFKEFVKTVNENDESTEYKKVIEDIKELLVAIHILGEGCL